MESIKKNILIISHPGKDAAGIIAFNLFEGFKEKGYNTKIFVKYSDNENIDVISMHNKLYWKYIKKIINRISRYCYFLIKGKYALKTDDDKYNLYSINETKGWYKTKKFTDKIPFNVDILFILFIDNYLNTKNIREIYDKYKCKIFWLLPDMAGMTGGCHYAWDCKGYHHQCGNCPAIYSTDKYDITYKNMAFKKINLKNIPLLVFSFSTWQHQQLNNSSLFKDNIKELIYFPINKNIFKPIDKKTSRSKFNLTDLHKVIFIGAKNLQNPRKGFKYLIEALKILYDKVPNENIIILISGKIDEDIRNNIKFKFISIDYLDQEKDLPLAFSASDVFVSPSIEDTGPTMVNLSLMCGTPVVAFRTGVANDLIIENETGLLADIYNSNQLADCILKIITLTYTEKIILSQRCRKYGLRKTTIEDQVLKLEKYFY
ncbi:MAG: glycosyltransferase [Candidatus Kapaibacterium sp.]